MQGNSSIEFSAHVRPCALIYSAQHSLAIVKSNRPESSFPQPSSPQILQLLSQQTPFASLHKTYSFSDSSSSIATDTTGDATAFSDKFGVLLGFGVSREVVASNPDEDEDGDEDEDEDGTGDVAGRV